ncbi:MAG: TonB-dependent receptor plug domain-containing protein [Opitutaceae bacterium]
MKSRFRLAVPRLLLSATFLALMPISGRAQATRAAPVDPATLAKYDRNHDGKLDDAEVAAQMADQARATAAVQSSTPATAGAPGGDTVTLSPFEVRESNNGYYASSTMSGTRLNTKLEDLASSISVVTKQQMEDFAMIDINDIFNYEASTEGTGNYTAFDIDRNGMVTDQIQDNPQGANRVRGIGAANLSLNGFASSGRAPIDPSNIDAVEISRGPNSSIFGLGEGSGTVNLVAATANISRESTAASLRFDDMGGWRTSLDVNRPLIAGKLALRVSGVYQHEEWRQKPSGFETRRFNAMVRYQPFKDTSIRASFSSYHGSGTRATAVTPRDAVSYWKTLGSPAWDPIANSVTVNGVTTVLTGTASPTGLAGQNFSNPVLFVDNGIQLWQVGRLPAATATNGPNNTSGTTRMLESVAEPIRNGRPLFSTLAGVSSRDVYDYSSINLGAPNLLKDQVETSTIEIEQFILNTERHKLAAQFAWQREDADRANQNVIGQASATSASYYLYVDPNTKLLDGRANPYFGRPYLGVGQPVTEEQPTERDSYRGQLAYILDYTNSNKWTKWIGRHQLLGYYEERKTKRFRYRFRDAMLDDNVVYAPAGQPKGNQSGTASPNATRNYYHFYVGDAQGANVDYAPSPVSYGAYTFNWYNAANGGVNTYPANSWIAETATLGRSAINEGSAGGNGGVNLIKTTGWMLQSTLLNERVIVTYGKRTDDNRNKNQRPSRLLPNGYEFDYAAMNGWVPDNNLSDGDGVWALRSGETTTKGIVAKPFRNWGLIDRARSAGGLKGTLAGALSGMTVFYNQSDSFRPETPAKSITLKVLPNPSSVGKDYGVSFNIGDKFVLRLNKYETNQINSRSGQSAIFATRTGRIDFAPFKGENDAIALQRQARNWTLEANPTFTSDQVNTAVAAIMQLPANYIAQINDGEITETSDVITRGNEFELTYNPNSYWTLRGNVTRSEAIDANLSPNIPAWLAERIPIWETIIDPRSVAAGFAPGTKWLDTGYSGDNPNVGSQTPRGFLNGNVINPLNIARATDGKSRSQIREWRVNFLTSYRLAGMFENEHLKKMTIGGGARWESKGSIGYYGIPVNGSIEAATSLDPNRPIYDQGHYYFDAFATYTTRLFKDRIRARFQLNVRNIQESKAHLRAVGAYPNGRPHTFRVIDPRSFIFTTTFDL